MSSCREYLYPYHGENFSEHPTSLEFSFFEDENNHPTPQFPRVLFTPPPPFPAPLEKFILTREHVQVEINTPNTGHLLLHITTVRAI